MDRLVEVENFDRNPKARRERKEVQNRSAVAFDFVPTMLFGELNRHDPHPLNLDVNRPRALQETGRQQRRDFLSLNRFQGSKDHRKQLEITNDARR
jgi:hypothetical protein